MSELRMIPPRFQPMPGVANGMEYTAGPVRCPLWTARTQMTGNVVLTTTSATYQFLDPNGSDRDCTLPVATTGMAFVIKHYGGANNVVVKASGGAVVATLAAGNSSTIVYDGTAWQVM